MTRPIVLGGIPLSVGVVRTLESVGLATDRQVRNDLARVRAGGAVALRDECLAGADDNATAAWIEYVDTLIESAS